MELLSQQPLFSTESTTKGFDLTAGDKWIYPENYPIREYQFTIVKTSLFHNTLVCLPTGLGKTFIAAVVMYNFWRWYPTGLIVFLAPTKPLVAQQIDACHDIMGIPISETIELTGAMNQKNREIAWRNKRVIFATPQTFQKDLEKGIVKTDLVKCVVIDEAHKALGKHAYCESVRLLHQTNPYYRLLALSATPGSKLDAVQEVIRNLHITHLELRDDTSSDITPYIHERKLEVIQVELGDDLTRFHERYLQIMDPHLRVLLKNNLIYGATSNITKARIFVARREFMNRQNKPYNHGSIMKELNILLSMAHANDLLINHGLRAFVHFFQNHSDKFWLKDEPSLSILIDEITEFIGPFPEIKSLMNEDETVIPDNIVFGHEKFNKLREILTVHFEKAAAKNVDTRAIVFIEYRDIVNEVFILLLQLRPLIRPQVFVGQAGLKQKQQKKALDEFRSNSVNVLISTSVGEEGLDVGEVDLIICFDILQHSPTRLVQRMGRTGRKRDGHIIILVTHGREHKTLKNALAKRDSLNNKVLHSSGIIGALGEQSPRMIPMNLHPQCLKMRITAVPATPRSKNLRKKLGKTRTTNSNVRNSVNEKKKSKNTVSALNKGTNCTGKIKGAIMKFLASTSNKENTNEDSNVIDMKIQGINSTQLKTEMYGSVPVKIRASDVKLLTSDNDAVEFLTIYMLKQSKQEVKTEEKSQTISYMPELSFDNTDLLLNINIPPISILNCIRSLSEYIPPCSNEFIEVHDSMEIDVWEPPDHFSHFANTSRCPESVLTHGRFEDLLDETSDSDITIFSGDDSFIDQRINKGNIGNTTGSIAHNNNDTKINKMDAFESIVINGAFEDILDESSDDSLIKKSVKTREDLCDTPVNKKSSLNESKSNSQAIENIDVINLITPEPDDSDKNINVKENNLSSACFELFEDKEEKCTKKNKCYSIDADLDENADFGSDFGLWDQFPVKDSRDTVVIPNTNQTVSPHNTSIPSFNFNVSLTKQKSSPIQTINSQVVDENKIEGRRSPDLSKLSQRRTKTKTNVTLNTVKQQSPVLESVKPIVEDTNSMDEDIFGVESLLLDSDFEDEITGVKNSNVEKCSVFHGNLNSNLNICVNSPIDRKNVNSIQNLPTNMESINSQKSKTNSVDDNYFLENFEWDSDFETSSTPITQSKYFKSNSNITSPNSCIEQLDKSKNSDIICSNTKFKENKLPQTKSKPAIKLVDIQDKFLSKVKSNIPKDLDSDDDFLPEKIEQVVFREMENSFSDDEVFSNNPSKLKTGNSLGHSSKKPQPLSTKNSNKFTASNTFSPKEKHPSVKNSSRIVRTKTISFDDSSKKKRRIRKHGRIKSAFIDDEAEVTLDGIHSLESSNDGDDGDETDDDLENFVSHSQYVDTAVDMKAYYLQSVRSPRGPGRFLIKRPKTPLSNIEICSQKIPDEPDTYLYDSFCVEEDDEPSENSNFSPDEVSILTEIERKLKTKKRKRKNSSKSSQPKRKRIIINVSDDTSEDESERLRAEIANQSMMLKNK